jgi:hypothetical protein
MEFLNKKYFFGWGNIKWFMREMGNMYSNKKSYFSKKRFESSLAFLAAISLIIGHAIIHTDTITNSEILADAALLFTIAGYTVTQIQKEKKEVPGSSDVGEEPATPAQAKKILNENKKPIKKEDFSDEEDSI